jgi:hypothetical protein
VKTIQWRNTSALTLTLSPEERGQRSPVAHESLAGGFAPAQEKLLPLPGGEGRGEGGPFSQLNNSVLKTPHVASYICWSVSLFND